MGDSSHYDQCKRDVLRYADGLLEATKKKRGRLNPSAISGLIDSYLNQPAFYVDWRDELHRIGMEHCGQTDDGDPLPDQGG